MARYRSPLSTFLVAALASARVACGLSLNISALSASDGESTLECWQMDTPFSISTEAGTAGSASLALGNLYVHAFPPPPTTRCAVSRTHLLTLARANLTYSVLPASFDGGLHYAPRPQYVSPVVRYHRVMTTYISLSSV